MADTTHTDTPTEGGIPFETIKDVFALRGKNVGCSLRLRGKVVLVTFLINDGESKWDKDAQNAMVECLKSTTKRLMNDSGLNRGELDIAYAYCQVNIPYVVTRRNASQFVKDVLRQFGYQTAQEYQKHYEEKFQRDEACISFVFNKSFRSYAVKFTAAGEPPQEGDPFGDEYSVVSFDPRSPASSERTLIHELMHQFGAIDYYYPPQVTQEAEKYLPGSIMDSGEVIDPLTRYVIGWDEELSEEAKAFLQAVSKIPPEEIACAKRDEWLGG